MVYQATILRKNRIKVQNVVFYVKFNNFIQIATIRKNTCVELLNSLHNGLPTFLLLTVLKVQHHA